MWQVYALRFCVLLSAWHGLPTLPIHGLWRSIDALLADVRSGAAFDNVTAWPAFLKACHLTQSSSYATRALERRPWAGGETEVRQFLTARLVREG